MVGERDKHIGHSSQSPSHFTGDIVSDMPASRELKGEDDHTFDAAPVESSQSIVDGWSSEFEIAGLNGSDSQPQFYSTAEFKKGLIPFGLSRAVPHD